MPDRLGERGGTPISRTKWACYVALAKPHVWTMQAYGAVTQDVEVFRNGQAAERLTVVTALPTQPLTPAWVSACWRDIGLAASSKLTARALIVAKGLAVPDAAVLDGCNPLLRAEFGGVPSEPFTEPRNRAVALLTDRVLGPYQPALHKQLRQRIAASTPTGAVAAASPTGADASAALTLAALHKLPLAAWDAPLRAAANICEAIAELHALGHVHGALRLHTLLVNAQGSPKVACLGFRFMLALDCQDAAAAAAAAASTATAAGGAVTAVGDAATDAAHEQLLQASAAVAFSSPQAQAWRYTAPELMNDDFGKPPRAASGGAGTASADDPVVPGVLFAPGPATGERQKITLETPHTPAADVYALGILIWEILTGESMRQDASNGCCRRRRRPPGGGSARRVLALRMQARRNHRCRTSSKAPRAPRLSSLRVAKCPSRASVRRSFWTIVSARSRACAKPADC